MESNNNQYIDFQSKLCISFEMVECLNISLPLWKKWSANAKKIGYKTRPGGNGRSSLIELKAIPINYRTTIIEKYGNPEVSYNILERFFEMDANARLWYEREFVKITGEVLEPYQIDRYTINASVLNALGKVRNYRIMETKIKGYARRDLKDGLAADAKDFQNVLKIKYNGVQHTLPENPRKLNDKLNKYLAKDGGYAILVDGRRKNTNAQVVTEEMLQLWFDLFAGQRHKPTHNDVHKRYATFLAGKLEIINSATGELHEPTAECYKEISDSSVYNWLSEWDKRVGLFKSRSGNRKTYMDRFTPSARMLRPTPGAIISVDDFQPPFKYAEGGGNRMWFYMGQDLGSTAITTWVYGDSKEGIITEFYKQLLRNYAEWGLNLPHEIECEAALNSSFVNTFLAPGVMFQKVRVLPNKPRAKRVERTIRDLRLQHASKHEAFVARPDATDENYQQKPGKQIYLSKEEIINFELGIIEQWNNELHPDQDLYPNMSRWDVFIQHQNKKLTDTNWNAILRYLGKPEPTSMNMGRVRLQYIDRVVGLNGEVATGPTLINIMNEIEGQQIQVNWLDDNNGNVLKANVYSPTGRLICELFDDLPFHRSEIDQTDQCRKNMALYFSYENTVTSHANKIAKSINSIEIIEKESKPQGSFRINNYKRREVVAEKPIKILEEPEAEPVYVPKNNDLLNRF